MTGLIFLQFRKRISMRFLEYVFLCIYPEILDFVIRDCVWIMNKTETKSIDSESIEEMDSI